MDHTTSNKGANLEGASLVNPLSSYQKEPDKGHRLCRIIIKGQPLGKVTISQGVIVPDTLSVSEAMKHSELSDALKIALQDLQDKQIRHLVSEGKTLIQHSDLSYQNLAVFAASQDESLGRLTIDEVKQWYDAAKGAAIEVYCAAKGLETAKVSTEVATKVHNIFVSLFGNLRDSTPQFTKQSHLDSVRLIVESVTPTEKLSQVHEKIVAKVKKAQLVDMDL